MINNMKRRVDESFANYKKRRAKNNRRVRKALRARECPEGIYTGRAPVFTEVKHPITFQIFHILAGTNYKGITPWGKGIPFRNVVKQALRDKVAAATC